MGGLPQVFNGDRARADDFIEEVKGYLRLNQDVAGYNSPIKSPSRLSRDRKSQDGPATSELGSTLWIQSQTTYQKFGIPSWLNSLPNSKTRPKGNVLAST
jgi:hypothetical protein